MTDSNIIALTFTTLDGDTGANWDTPIPNQTTTVDGLPASINVNGNVSGVPTPVLTLPTTVTGITINAGIITAADTTSEGVHSIVCRATNSGGTDDSQFTWTVPVSLVWSPIDPAPPTHQTGLPGTYDVSGYVTSTAGTPTNYQLVSPPVGFSIDSSTGIVTAAVGTMTSEHYLTVRVDNDRRTETSAPFLWSIRDDLFNETVTDVTETTCTATVDSATDQGTLYMAVRASGSYPPYGVGSENDIKNGVGAVFSSFTTPPLIGTNSFSVTGLTSGTGYHVGFVIELP